MFGVSEYWRLATRLRIADAIQIILGIEPQSSGLRLDQPHKWPNGFSALRESIVSAIRTDALEGGLIYEELDAFGDPVTEETTGPRRHVVDLYESWVDTADLKHWLSENGFEGGYFFYGRNQQLAFLDSDGARYAPKLAAAVEAWIAFDEFSTERGTPKQRLKTWLRSNAARFGLTNEDGTAAESVIEDIAKIANWAPAGGAPKRLNSQKEDNLDDEIPF